MDIHELPLGFGFALAQNPEAMRAYTGMTREQQSQVLEKAHSVSSKREMQALVKGLTAG